MKYRADRQPGLKQALDRALAGQGAVFGVNLPLAVRTALQAARLSGRPALFVAATPAQAEEVLLNARTFLGEDSRRAQLFSPQSWQEDKELENLSVSLERMECYAGLLKGEISFVAAPLLALLQDVPDPAGFRRRGLELSLDREYPPSQLARDLFDLGYERVEMVQFRGEFTVRGGIVDIFPLTEENPLRLEYFGDEITDLRRFDLASQRSLGPCLKEGVTIYSASERNTPDPSGASTLLDYFDKPPLIVWHEMAAILKEWEKWSFGEEVRELLPAQAGRMQAFRQGRGGGALYLADFESDLGAPPGCPALRTERRTFALESSLKYWPDKEQLKPFDYALRAAAGQIADWHAQGWQTIIHCATDSDRLRLGELLAEQGLPKEACTLVAGPLSGGWILPEVKEAVLTDDQIFQRALKRRSAPRTKVRPSEPIDNLATIEPGTLVVHLNHGIGIYEGIVRLDSSPDSPEMIQLRYADNALLYVSLSQASLIERYINVGGRKPELDSLKDGRWKKRCRQAEKAVLDLASELLERQAQRAAKPGFAALPDTDWQKSFELAFPYSETIDQLRAVKEVKEDMEAPRAMDRLICGDVGFGKTEVALRAAFKAVMSGRQVAVLVPTTILAHQHLQTFHDRMAQYPVRLAELSRFVPAREQKRIARELAAGEVDVVIGTHRLLSQDIKIPNLGLVIVDEEQRFGVRHKEKLKRLSQLTDVLSLSATPIPRTLYQSLTGLRDMSVIMTPPEERLPVRTTAIKKSGPVIRDAIRREAARGGQVFYLHNRVETIYSEREALEKLLPGLRIAVAHGQMAEGELEGIIEDFVEGRYDVLLCTMIVESGIDMPNVNTIIIDDAHMFGLSDLYQLRGRVGRSTRQAYAYLVLPKHLPIDSVARHRLRAVMENTALGSGYQIAMKDLELRGAGNILGAQQSGHIVSIGFGLYCKLLNRAIQLVKSGKFVPPKGRDREEVPEGGLEEALRRTEEKRAPRFDWRKELPSLSPSQDFVALDIPLRGDIPDSYIQSTVLRLDLFRRVSAVRTMKELSDLREEIQDRFGQPPKTTELLLDLTEIAVRARARGLDALEHSGPVLIPRSKGRIVNPHRHLPEIDFKKPHEAVMAILAFLSRLPLLPGAEE